MPVFAFIDTNVLLHCAFVRDVDWASLLGAKEVTLVFTQVVVGELDRHKWAGTRREKQRAQSVLKALFDLGLSPTVTPLRAGASMLAIPAEPSQAELDVYGLQKESKDDQTLASLLTFRAAHQGDRVLLVTADYGVRLKTVMRNIELFVMPDELKLPDEPDEVERELKETKRQLDAALRAIPEVKLTVRGATRPSFDVKLVEIFEPNRRASLLSEWRKANPLAAETPKEVRRLGGNDFFLRGGLVSANEAKKYNASVEQTFRQYEQFLDLWPLAINAKRRCLQFNFVLVNAGSAPALDVVIEIRADAEGEWLEKPPKLPVEPELPRMEAFHGLAQLPPLLGPVDVFRMREDREGPDIVSAEPPIVKYRVKSILHHVPYELPRVYFQMQHNGAVKPFGLHCRIIAANLREPKEKMLAVQVTASAPQSPPSPYQEPDDDE